MRWVFTPDEFTYVWSVETGRDRRPYPINMAHRGTVRSENDREKLDLAERFPRNVDPDLTGALTLCARSDVTTITVSGDRYGADGRAEEPILAFGAAHLVWGTVLIAGPCDVTVIACHARTVPRHLVDAMGHTPPGRLATMREPREAVLYDDPNRWDRTEAADRAAVFRETLHRPIDARGFITVTVSPEDPMSPPTRHRTWLDFTGDGRYLLTTATHLTLAPVTDTSLTTHLRHLAAIR
ncbi:ESX secretion-associated protein EspG [Nocardia puris]|uniref:ESAT-6 protein secretion system EspG family protein n=1 Tax=Nocardia puris TaxID=208602 RepID=A0A366CZ59_9NOCA|nr:ESX secretion-associated protein EspG [Nocardia puris]RBO83093.1 ESAT-6 protein secretion system EspG family protein [Nocardia puris]